jgi:hypothetical protein
VLTHHCRSPSLQTIAALVQFVSRLTEQANEPGLGALLQRVLPFSPSGQAPMLLPDTPQQSNAAGSSDVAIDLHVASYDVAGISHRIHGISATELASLSRQWGVALEAQLIVQKEITGSLVLSCPSCTDLLERCDLDHQHYIELLRLHSIVKFVDTHKSAPPSSFVHTWLALHPVGRDLASKFSAARVTELMFADMDCFAGSFALDVRPGLLRQLKGDFTAFKHGLQSAEQRVALTCSRRLVSDALRLACRCRVFPCCAVSCGGLPQRKKRKEKGACAAMSATYFPRVCLDAAHGAARSLGALHM